MRFEPFRGTCFVCTHATYWHGNFQYKLLHDNVQYELLHD